MSKEVRDKLQYLRQRRLLRYCMHALGWTLSITGGAAAWAYALEVLTGYWLVGIAALALIAFAGAYPPKKYLSYRALIEELHKTYPFLEYSLHFLLLPNSTPYYRLLLERIQPRVQAIDTLPYPRSRYGVALWSGACLLSLLIVWSMHAPLALKKKSFSLQESVTISSQRGDLSVATEWVVFPPAYTGKPPTRETQANFQVVEGSDLHLKVSLSDSVQSAYLLLNFTDTLPLRANTAKHYGVRWRPAKSGLYQLHLLYHDSLYVALTRQITIRPDSMPRGRWLAPAHTDVFVPYSPHALPVYRWALEAFDDFGIESIQATLTIARGSGEQVRFYEKTLPLAVTVMSKRHQRALLELKPLAWGATWGDELFVSVWVRDNKKPNAQIAQLPVLRLMLEDTTTQWLSAEGLGIGMNRLPEYFRSQRQIIIDTEELLKKSKQLTDSLFRWQAQNIAFDQKALRMRYGKFLGEEDYLTPAAVHAPHEEEEEGDSGEEHHEHEKEVHEHAHTPMQEPHDNLLHEYLHLHDLSEINTFLDPATRDTLKKALAAMWESEKYLRLAKPRQALPFQYEALKYLKMVQQKSRVYVRKSGVELPPLSEEYRLSKAEEVPQKPHGRIVSPSQAVPSYDALVQLWQSLWLSTLTGKPLSTMEAQSLWKTTLQLPLTEEQQMKLLGKIDELRQNPTCSDCKQYLLKQLFILLRHPVLPQRPLFRVLQVP